MTRMTPEIIIKRIETGYTEIMALYQGMSEAALMEPVFANDWSPKDTVGHLAAWVWRCAALLELGCSSDGPLKVQPDVERLNHEFYQERRTWGWVEIEADFRGAHVVLLDIIRQLPPERLGATLVQQTIAQATWEHYAEYGPDLSYTSSISSGWATPVPKKLIRPGAPS